MFRSIARYRLLLPASAALLLIGAGVTAFAQNALTHFTPPSGSPSSARVAPIPTDSVQTPAAEFARIRWATLATGGNLPNGCTTLNGQQICVPAVTVDGQRIPDITILSALLGRPQTLGPALASRTTGVRDPAMQSAISQAVLTRLIVLQATTDHTEATLAQGRAYALQQFAVHQQIERSDPGVAAQLVPPGRDPREWFNSDEAARGYQAGLTAANESRKLFAPTSPAGPTAAAQAAASSFFSTALAQHQVTIDGQAPTFTLTSALRSP